MSLSSSSSLPPNAFRRQDESPDARFYAVPRFVTHIDDGAIAAVTQLYREFFPPDGAILDLMSSWISHLPEEVAYNRVAGVGMNAEELSANPRLTEWTVQDLNAADPRLPFTDAAFDGCGLCVSIDYLTDPVAVLREAARVLRPNAPIVLTFSNRCFPTKAIALWHALSDQGHLDLVAHLLEEAGGFDQIERLDRSPHNGAGRLSGDPLYAVVARRAG